MVISIVDPTRDLVALEKTDDTQYASNDRSGEGANGRAVSTIDRAVFYDAIKTGQRSIALIGPTVVGIPGAVFHLSKMASASAALAARREGLAGRSRA